MLSPLPQSMNVPTAVWEYLYEVLEPVQPAGNVGKLFRNGPARAGPGGEFLSGKRRAGA